MKQWPNYKKLAISPQADNDRPLADGPSHIAPMTDLAYVGQDFDHLLISAGSDNFTGCIFAQYGPPIVPVPNGEVVRRYIDRTTDVTNAAGWTEIGTITDLDTRKMYGLSFLHCIPEDQASLVRVKSPSAMGIVPAVPGSPGVDFVNEFGQCACHVSGLDTLSIEARALADNQVDAVVELKEVSMTGGGGGSFGGGGSRGGGGGGFRGVLGGAVGRLMGGM